MYVEYLMDAWSASLINLQILHVKQLTLKLLTCTHKLLLSTNELLTCTLSYWLLIKQPASTGNLLL